jgi:hypothetical protein
MGKRKADNQQSPFEIRLSSQHHYDGYIKSDRQKRAMQPETKIDPRKVPDNSRIRPCWSCDCTNEQGYCDNYFLYAVLRDGCRMPEREAT